VADTKDKSEPKARPKLDSLFIEGRCECYAAETQPGVSSIRKRRNEGGTMKHKIMWSLIGVMAVVALVLASCTGGGGNGGNGGNGEEEPQYGGTIAMSAIVHPHPPGWLGQQMQGFDPLVWDNNSMLVIIFDRYFTVPWEKGPAGTGEYGEYRSTWYPRSLYEGELLESFEVIDLYTVNYKIREGINYWDKEPVTGRELTVDDIMWNWLRDIFQERDWPYLRVDPALSAIFWADYLQEIEDGLQPAQPLIDHLAFLKEVTPELEEYYPGLEDMMRSEFATSYNFLRNAGYDVDDLALLSIYLKKIDDYTFEAHSARCNRELWSYINGIWPTPREVTEVDEFTDWETVVGTGPWIPTSFFPESEATFVRNDDYWQYDPVHPENQLPYADELVILVIEDETAYYAALETAQLDVGYVEWYKVDYFKENCPDMLYKQKTSEWTHCIFLRNDIPPFNDMRVRYACMLAVDHETIFNERYKGESNFNSWPQQLWSPCYQPLEEHYPETQALYGYDPDEARALLADAGYPDGFETEMTVYPWSEDIESCLVVQQYLADVGIDIEMQTPDAATLREILYGKNYQHMISCWWANTSPDDAMLWAEGGVKTTPFNFSMVDDPQNVLDSMEIACILDEDEYFAKIKESDRRRLRDMYHLILPTPVDYVFWRPWLKNYHGEGDLGYPDSTSGGEIPKYLWIDQDLKDDMT